VSEEPQKKVLELAAALLEETPAARARRLAEVPPDIARAVESLIAAAEEAEVEGFLSAPTSASAAAGADPISLLARGTSVGRFLILEAIGAGGMGVVYAAYDPQLERKVAVKLLRPDRSSGSKARLLREAQALARLAHPNVVSVFEVGAFGEQIFVAMEFVEGRSLRVWLRDERPPWPAVVATFVEAARGLQAAHDAGLVHRDFKPDNVLMGNDGRVRVVDFGLARAIGTDEFAEPPGASPLSPPSGRLLATRLTREGAVIGTPGFVAPEVLAGDVADARSDQFSFAVALRQALAGTAPAEPGEDERLEARLSGVPRRLLATIERAMARDPERRFASLAELATALNAVHLERRRRWAAIGAAAIVSMVLVALSWAWSARASRCSGAPVAIASAWNARRSAELERAFAASALPFAQSLSTKVVGALTRYAERWAAMHTEACEATRRNEQSPALLDLRMSCLEERRVELGRLAELLASADAATLEGAADAVARLSDLEDCRNATSLLAAAPEPTDPLQQARVQDARTQLAGLRAVRAAGHIDDALAELRPLAAERLEHAPTRAEVLAFYGLVALQNGLRDEARRPLADAEWLAIAGNAAAPGFDAALASAWSHFQGNVDLVAAEHSVDVAQAWLDRLGDSPLRRMRLAHARSRLADYGDREEEALAWLDRAIATAEGSVAGSAEQTFLPLVVARKGDLLTVLGRAIEARPMLEWALELNVALQGEDHFERVYDYNSLGSNAVEAGDFERARTWYAKSQAIARRTLPQEHLLVAETHLYQGELEWLSERPEGGLREAREAERMFLAIQADDTVNAARAQLVQAVCDADLGRLAPAAGLAGAARRELERAVGEETSTSAVAALTEGRILLLAGHRQEAKALLGPAANVLAAGGLGPRWAAMAAFYEARAQWETSDASATALRRAALDRARQAVDQLVDNPRWARERRDMLAWLERRSNP
jgi:predicted Ser/Thr protein kinase/tetratricopeptide (TPR) repeat protein